MKIKDIPLIDRPIERLINKGVTSLSNEELLAIIIRTGTKEKSAKDISSELIGNFGSLKNLANSSYEQLKTIKGIGKSKSALLMSCFELSKRINTSIDSIINIKANRPDIIFNYYKQLLSDRKQEYFYAIYLNIRNRIIKDKLLYIGTINYSIVHPREVFREAYLAGASSIILLHNHPGGSVFPSKNDIDTTKRLKEVGDLMGIKIVDHIIIGKDKYYSFYENNDLWKRENIYF